MYLAGYIERMGTGTGDIIRLCKEAGLKEPEFIQEEIFKTIIWRKIQATGQVTGQVTEPVNRLVLVTEGEMKRAEIQEILGLKHREHFLENYLTPAISHGLIEMTHPENPNHPYQKYRLTAKGKKLKEALTSGGRK